MNRMWCGDPSPHRSHWWGRWLQHTCRGKGQFSWFRPPDYEVKGDAVAYPADPTETRGVSSPHNVQDDIKIVADALRVPNLWSGSQMQFDALRRIEEQLEAAQANERHLTNLLDWRTKERDEWKERAILTAAEVSASNPASRPE